MEYAAHGVRVNAIALGEIDTPFVKLPLAELPDPEKTIADIAATHPLNRIDQPEEVADAIIYLALPQASFITGVTLPIDGGYTAVQGLVPIDEAVGGTNSVSRTARRRAPVDRKNPAPWFFSRSCVRRLRRRSS
ncbi:SDR family oxidoreductase [Microbacterium sp. YMB-B2]|uniref:SDR family oxidoreductase n=1 Tax=Microbacterium tenebrionis TaxID=2830665 RepID=A0A9X1S198_9MICO|nr:SDR family oxidoreductase [Microbacterium tenebrionis]